MHVHHALDRLELIHDHLARSEVYRGFRVPAVALVGILAFVAAGAQQLIPEATTGTGFVVYWVAIAGVCGLLGTATAVHRYTTREDAFARRRTRRVSAQFLPCILGGALVTVALARFPEVVAFLPGLWAVIFGLGIVATRPYLPAELGWIGFGYVAVGGVLLLRTLPTDSPSGLAVGSVFGVGHLLTALVLWRDLEGESDDRY